MDQQDKIDGGKEITRSKDNSGDNTAPTKVTTEEEFVAMEDNLIDAIKQDRLDAVQKLQSEGCNPNEPTDVEGNRPLHWALFTQKADFVRMLLDAGVDVKLAGKQNATPFMVTPSLYRRDGAPWEIVHSFIKL